MGKTYRPYDPRQSFLLPPSPLEWLPDEHLAYFVLDVVEELKLSAITSKYEAETRGQPPHDPRMMVALLVYGYCVGERSSRRIEKKTVEDVAFRVLAGGNHPDHSRISEFRRIHLEALSDLFFQVLMLCRKAKLVKLGHVALDGTKMKANASKHKAMSYQRMKEDEARLKAEIATMFQEAESIDAAEDARHGKDQHGDELPDELRRRETRLVRIRQLRAELEAEAQQQRREEAAKRDDDDEPPPAATGALPSHKIPTDKGGAPAPKAQRNFTDADSRIMKKGGDYLQGYNCQAAVDEGHQIIVARAVTNQPPDVEHFAPMVEQVACHCGEPPRAVTADAGYYSEENTAYALTQGIDPHIATGRRKHNEPPPVVHGPAPKDQGLKQWMARKLETKKGAAVYARRKAVVEPVFGQIKEARGIRAFLLRGLDKVRGEWSLIAMTHNLLKLYRATRLQPA